MPALRARVWSHSALRHYPTASTAMDRMGPSSTERRDEPRSGGGATAEQAAEGISGVKNAAGVEGGVRVKPPTYVGDDEGDEDGAEVVGLAVTRLGFGQVSTPVGVHVAGLILGVELVAVLNADWWGLWVDDGEVG